MTLEDYENGFEEFISEAISSENRKKYRVAISNYYKALTELISYLIVKELEKTPKSHTEIFLFLKASFPEINEIVDPLFEIYQKTYTVPGTKEDCEVIKNGIKRINEIKGFSDKIRKNIEKIQ